MSALKFLKHTHVSILHCLKPKNFIVQILGMKEKEIYSSREFIQMGRGVGEKTHHVSDLKLDLSVGNNLIFSTLL